MRKLHFIIIFSFFLHTLYAGNPSLDSAIKYFDIGYYSKALQFAMIAFNETEPTTSKPSPEYKEALGLIAGSYSWMMNFRSAGPYFIRLLDIMRESGGINYDYIETADSYADILAADGKFNEMDSLFSTTIRNCKGNARIEYVRVLWIRKLMTFGLEDKADSLSNTLDRYYDDIIDEYLEAHEGSYFSDKTAKKKYLDSLTNLRLNRYYQDKDRTDPGLAQLLLDSGDQYDSLNFYTEADSIFLYCEKFATKRFGPRNEFSIQSILNRANIRKEKGDYLAAYELINKAEPVARTTYGKSSVLYGDILRNTANYLYFLGRDEEAIKYFDRSYEIFNNELSKVNSYYSALIMDMSKCKDISELLREVIAATEKRGVYCNTCYSYLLLKLADDFESKFMIEDAEALYFKALNSLSSYEAEGYEEIRVALADFYVRCRAKGVDNRLLHYGHYEQVEEDGQKLWKITARDPVNPYYNELLERIYDNAINNTTDIHGRMHPAVADLELSKALLYWGWKPQFETIIQFNRALEIYLEITRTIFPFLTETERIVFYNSNRRAIETFMAYIVSEKIENPLRSSNSYGYKDTLKLRELMGKDTLNFKIRKTIDDYYYVQYSAPGLLLNYRLATKGMIYESVSAVKNRIRKSNDSLLIRKFNLWKSMREAVAGEQDKHKQDKSGHIRIDSLTKAADSLERWLSVRSQAFRDRDEKELHTWRDIYPLLNWGDVAVDVIKCHHPMYYRTNDPAYEDSVFYGFLILSKFMGGKVILVVNTRGGELESRYYPYYCNSIKYRQEDTVSIEPFWGNVDKTIRSYGGYHRIYFSPDGIYNKINLNTLEWPSGKYLIDRYDIHFLSNLKDLLRTDDDKDTGTRESILFGNPDFGNKTRRDSGDSLKERSIDITNLLKEGVDALPGTQKELQIIGSTLSENNWKVTDYEGSVATESNLKMIQSPEILHIATHGFFNDDFSAGNPLYNSGLLLAEIGEPSPGGIDDGIFTAYEATDLDLRGCEMVVLSACESGLGKIETGEGVYGLQRAFKVAGAESILISLWKVNDHATQELMSEFYRNIGEGTDGFTAFKAAQLDLKKKYPHPYYWGAFVLSGH